MKCGIANAGLTPTVSIPARVSWIEMVELIRDYMSHIVDTCEGIVD